MALAMHLPPPRPFEDALRGTAAPAVIAEYKRSSPSAGAIAEPDLASQARAYEDGGAAAISVLTEPTRFDGSLADVRAARLAVDLPVLRKDFLVHPAQLIESRAAAADAVLLIAAALSELELKGMLAAAEDLGLGTLVETHSEEDLAKALATEAPVVGVNARDLETLEVDVERALALLPKVPSERVAVLESGVSTRAARRASDRRRRPGRAGGRGADAVPRPRGRDPIAPGRDVSTLETLPDERGRFGAYGGRYVPEVLIPALDELAAAWSSLRDDPGFRGELDALLRDFVGRPSAMTFAPRLSEATGYRDLPQARGPEPHGRAQDQQHARPGAARPSPGQGQDHRRDGGRDARGRDRDGLRAVRSAVRGLHGRGGHRSAGSERRPDAAARRRGRHGHLRQPNAQGRAERGAAGLGGERGRHALRPRVGRGTASVPGARARPPAGDRRRGEGPDPRTRGRAIPTSWSPASAVGATRSGSSGLRAGPERRV